jgi:hypothetical protein
VKKFKELNRSQKLKALLYIETELRSFMSDENMKIYFSEKPTEEKIKSFIRDIAETTAFDDNGNVLPDESLND